jgi:hypothetical protein
MDNMGETYGADSSQYRNHAIRQDVWLSKHIVEWLDRGYNILVTGDTHQRRSHTRRYHVRRARGASVSAGSGSTRKRGYR